MARVIKQERTLQGVMEKLRTESGMLLRLWKIELAAGGVLLVGGLLLSAAPAAWLGGFLLFLGLAHSLKARENDTDAARFRGGAQGEAEVSEAMEKGLPDTYLILNDISVRAGMKKAQNDHIVLGPNGVFVIETKAYSGRLVGDSTTDTLEQHKEYRGNRTTNRIKNPIPQNAYHCEVVMEKMKQSGFAVDDVHSVIVFTNKWVRLEIAGAEVPVVRTEDVCDTILRTTSHYGYDAEYLARLAHCLAPDARIDKS